MKAYVTGTQKESSCLAEGQSELSAYGSSRLELSHQYEKTDFATSRGVSRVI